LQTELLEHRLAPAVSLGPVSSYAGNGDTSFGGPIGHGSLNLSDNGSVLSGNFTKGPNGFKDVLVLYIDSVPGGFTDTSGFADGADGLRRAISGFDGGSNRSTLTFQASFRPDFAIALGPASDNFGGLWQLASGGNNSLNFINGVNLSPTGNSASTYTFSVALSDLGITGGSGATIELLGTYISNTGFRSAEAVAGNVSGSAGWNPFTQTAVASYTTANASIAVPENTTATFSGTYGGGTTSVSGPGVVDNHNGTWTWSGTGDESSPTNVTVTGNDGSTATFSVSFTDVTPAVAITSAPASVAENAAASASGTFSDVDDNITSLTASEGTLTPKGLGSTSGSWTWSETPPLSDGSHTVTLTATNSDGSTATTSFTFTVTDLPPTFVSQAHDSVATTQGGVPATNSGVFSDYDDTIAISASQGTLTDHHDGTWNWSQDGTTSDSGTVTVTATNTDGATASTTFTVTFNPPVRITTTALADATNNRPYSQTISTTGGTGLLSFSITSGTLPAGMNLSPAGVLSGTPTVAGTYTFEVTATDSVGARSSFTYTWTIVSSPTLSYAGRSFSAGHFALELDGAILELVDTDTSTVLTSQPVADTTSVQITGNPGGNNTLILDFSHGDFTLAGGINFDGVSGSSLVIIGSGGEAATYSPSTKSGAGTATIAGNTVVFEHLAPVEVSNVASFILFTNGNHFGDITRVSQSVAPSDPSQPAVEVSGTTGFEPIFLHHVGTAVIQTPAASDDAIEIAGVDFTQASVTNFTVNTNTDGTDAVTLDTGATTIAGTLSILENSGSEFRLAQPLLAGVLHVNASTADVDNTVSATTITGDAGTVNVAAPGQIQIGIDLAASGAMVNVAAGTYTGNLVIPEPLTLAGAGAGSSSIEPSVSDVTQSLVYIQADNVTIHDFTLEGNNPSISSGQATDGVDTDAGYGILVDTSAAHTGLVVSGNTVQDFYKRGIMADMVGGGTYNIHDNSVINIAGTESGVAIFGREGSGTITHNFVDSKWDGINTNYSHGTVISNNTVLHAGTFGFTDGNAAIHSDNYGGAGISGPDLIENNIVSSGGQGSIGIWAFMPYGTVTIQGNTISGVDVGLASFGGTATGLASFVNNSVSTSATSFDGGANTEQYGAYLTTDTLGFGDFSGSASLTGNILSGNRYGTVVSQVGAPTTVLAVKIYDNDLSGNAVQAISNPTGTLVDASGNWWGTNTPSGVAAAAGANVDYTPWLDSGANSAVGTGFLGSFHFLHVGAASPQAGAAGRIQEAINLVSGSTILIHNGTYNESNIAVPAAVTIEGESQRGVIIAPALADAHQDSGFGGVVSNGFVIQHSDVSIETLTLDGNGNAALPGTQNFRAGIITDLNAGAFGNIVVDHVTMQNIFRRGVALYGLTSSFAPSHVSGDQVTNSTFSGIGTDGSALSFESPFAVMVFNSDALISGNVITNSGGGIGSNYLTSPADAPQLTITGNSISSPADFTPGALGMDLSGLAGGSMVSGNSIDMTGGSGHDIALIVQYAAPGGDVSVHDNGITTDSGDTGIYLYQNSDTSHPALIDHNTITGTSATTGILVTDDGSIFGESPHAGTTYATLTRNTISGVETGVEVTTAGGLAAAQVGGSTVGEGNSITTNTTSGIGVLVTGAGASATAESNVIKGCWIGLDAGGKAATVSLNRLSANGTGILLTNAGTASIDNNDFTGAPSNTTDLRLDGDAGLLMGSFAGNQFAASTTYIDNHSPQNLDASADTFNVGPGGAQEVGTALTLSEAFAVEDHITDYLDNPAFGYVSLNPDDVYVTQQSEQTTAGAIQRGVNVGPGGGCINVQAGRFIGEIVIDMPLHLEGAQVGINPNTAAPPASAQTIIQPDTADATSVTLITIESGGVTLDGFTVDGNNPDLPPNSNTIDGNGVTIDAVVGVVADGQFDNLAVQNNIIENISVFGIYFDAESGSSTGAVIAHNQIDNLPDPSFGGTGMLLADNFYGTVSDNVLTRTWDGIVLNHYGDVGAGTIDVSHNAVQSSDSGIYLLDAYAGSGQVSISHNTMTAVAGSTTNRGLSLEGVNAGAAVSVTGNDVTGGYVGVFLWGNPGGVTVSGGTLSSNDYGVLADNFDDRTGAQAGVSSTGTINGVTISASGSGLIKIRDTDSLPTDGVVLVVTGNTHLSGGPVGVSISGHGASADIHDNLSTVTGTTIGIDIDGGSATVTSNTITGNGTGIRVTDGGSLTSASFNAITNNSADGILVTASAGSVAPLMCNDFSGDAPYGVENQSATVVDARKDYWGSPSGPTSPGNPVGTGVQVSSNVLYSPFATNAACTMFSTPLVEITTATLPNITQGFAYNQTITAIGGTGSLTFATSAGTLPTGLTLSTSGVVSGTPTTPGSYTFTVMATDTVGVSDSHSYTIAVSPAVQVTTTTVTAPEGSNVSNTGTFSNYGVTLSASSGIVTQDNVNGTWSWSGPAPDDTPYDVTISATGTNGVISTASFHVAFTDVAPTFVSQAFNSVTTTAGVAASNSGVFSEFDDPPLVISASQGTLTDHGDGTWSWSQNGTQGDSGTVTVTATNADGSKTSTTFSLTINPALVITTTALPDGIVGQAGYNQTIAAGGGTGSRTLAVTAGSLPTGLTLAGSSGVISGTPTTIGSYSFTITATDAVGAMASQAYTIHINNLPSRLAFGTEPTNTPTGVTLAPVTVNVFDSMGNPATGDNTDTVTISVLSGPGSFAGGSTTTVTVHGGVATFSNLKLIVPGTYTLHAVLPALSADAQSTSFSVLPLQVVAGSFAPSPSGFSVSFNAPYLVNSVTPALYGSGFKSTATVTPTVTLTQTTGTPPSGSSLPFQVSGSVVLNQATNSLTFVTTDTVSLSDSGTPILPDGVYVVQITSSGANGLHAFFAGGGYLDGKATGTPGSGDYTATFTVGAAAAHSDVVWIPPTADGPGQPLVAPGNNQAGGGYPLYLSDTTGSVTQVSATLTYNPALLTIMSGSGSPGLTVMVTAPGTATVTYSGPALAAGTQTPIGYLGWSGPEATPSLSSGGGLVTGTTYYYVITATDGGSESMPGVQSVAVTPGGGNNTVLLTWPRGILADGYKIYRSTTPGSGYNLLATVSGGGSLFYVDSGAMTPAPVAPPTTGSTAQVPAGTALSPVPYKQKDLLHLSGVALNSGAIPVVTSDAVHVVAYAGDADGNGGYSANDAVLITRALLSTDSGFSAYPLVDPVIVADTDGSGFIPADAAFQANEAGVGLATRTLSIPAVPAGVNFTPIGNNVDPSLTLPSHLHVGADGTVTLAVNLDDAHPEGSTGLTAGHLALTYDPRVFTVSAADVHLGSLLAAGSGWSVVPTIDPATGQIAIALSSATPITRILGGSLVTIDFHQLSGEPGDVSARSSALVTLADSVIDNGQYLRTELEDAQGTFTLTMPSSESVVTLVTSGVGLSGAQFSSYRTVSSASPADHDVPGVVEAMSSAAVLNPSGADVYSMAETNDVESPSTPPALAESETPHGSAARAAAASASASTVVAAPLTGLVFQLATAPNNTAGIAGWQHLADQLFQALGRTPGSEPVLVGAIQTLEHALAGQLLLDQPTSDSVDMFNWDEAADDVGWLAARHQPVQQDAARLLSSVVETYSDPAVLDQLFGQSTDDTDALSDAD
jgi:hypothetical protein